jgi:hypothetical protein
LAAPRDLISKVPEHADEEGITKRLARFVMQRNDDTRRPCALDLQESFRILEINRRWICARRRE